MKQIFDQIFCTSNCWLKLCTLTSIVFILLGIFLPPVGVIDNSIIMAIGELFAFAALGEGVKAIQSGHTTKLKIKEMELEITKNGE